jgi:hypothetical protein
MCLWRRLKNYLKPLSQAGTFKVGVSCTCSDSRRTYLHLYACSVEMMWVLKAGVHDVWIGYRAVESTGKPVDSSSKFAKWIWVDNSEASYTNLARQKCFKVFLEPKTWHQAQRACEQWDRESSTVSSQDTYSDGRSGLASVTSSEDARFLSELALDVAQKYANQNTAKAHTMQQIYIGFNRRHTKDFVWSDGSGMSFLAVRPCGSALESDPRVLILDNIMQISNIDQILACRISSRYWWLCLQTRLHRGHIVRNRPMPVAFLVCVSDRLHRCTCE